MPPNADFPAPIVPSSPPQRFERGTKTKTEATQRSKGKCKHELTETLPEDVGSTWEETKDRLIWELLEVYYFRPAGGPINRETAFALTRKALGEDLHRSVSNLFYRDCDRLPMRSCRGNSHLRLRLKKPEWMGSNLGCTSGT